MPDDMSNPTTGEKLVPTWETTGGGSNAPHVPIDNARAFGTLERFVADVVALAPAVSEIRRLGGLDAVARQLDDGIAGKRADLARAAGDLEKAQAGAEAARADEVDRRDRMEAWLNLQREEGASILAAARKDAAEITRKADADANKVRDDATAAAAVTVASRKLEAERLDTAIRAKESEIARLDRDIAERQARFEALQDEIRQYAEKL